MEYDYCSHCGAKYTDDFWPRYCSSCQKTIWRNPKPVVVIQLELNQSPKPSELLVLLRKNEPRSNQWALPGGFMEIGETWQEAAARELEEETGIKIKPEQFTLLKIVSEIEGYSNLLLFCRARIEDKGSFQEDFSPNEEVAQIKFISQEIELAFDTHQQIMKEFFKYR